ncbi:transposase, partial [Shigella boydii]
TLKSPSYTKSVSWQHYPFILPSPASPSISFVCTRCASFNAIRD